LLFFIPAFSLAGFPPLSGFWAKFILLKAAFISGNFIVAIIALVVSFITLYSMIKVWNHVFWKEPPPTKTLTNPVLITLNEKICLYLPVIILAGLTTIMGLLPALFFRVSMNSANQLFNRSQYIHAVMGKNER
jgi:multicomponent Na+:H+ antiporter subunit D